MVDHNAHADARGGMRHTRSNRNHDAGRLMPGNHQRAGFGRGAKAVKIGAAHARSPHGHDDFPTRRRGIFECLPRDRPVSRDDDALRIQLPYPAQYPSADCIQINIDANKPTTYQQMANLNDRIRARNMQNQTSAAMNLRLATSLPLIVDADTGFGNALNVHYTVRALEAAGANAIQIEDQAMPKKCGHFASKAVVSRSEAVARIRAAVEARQDGHFQIVARTDARAVHGLDEALERAALFREAGADVIFVEAPESRAEIERIIAAVDAPHIVNLVIGGKTPTIGQDAARQMGCAMLLYANVALQSAVFGMQSALATLKADGRVDENTPGIASFEDRQRLVRKPEFDELDHRHAIP